MAGKKTSVDCGEAMTIAQSAELHQKLKAALEDSSSIELKADAVEKVDTAGLQLIIALEHEIEKVSGKLSWKDPSDTLKQAATTLGLAERLEGL